MRLYLMVLAFALAACEAGVTSLPQADGGRHTIECASSYVSFNLPGNYKCEQFASTGAGFDGESGRSAFQTFNLFGNTADGTKVNLQAKVALNNGYYKPNPSANWESVIKAEDNAVVRRAVDWQTLSVVAHARVMRFMDPDTKTRCFGFFRFGGLALMGYANSSRGFFCRTTTSAPDFSDEEIENLINKVVVRNK